MQESHSVLDGIDEKVVAVRLGFIAVIISFEIACLIITITFLYQVLVFFFFSICIPLKIRVHYI